MTLIKDLIDIPERVQKGDFVLRLTEGVNRPEDTLRDYVVTPELKDCFDNALTFISSGFQSNTSKATYLHGSFGSGKSHFMAVLHLILQGNPQARSITELASVITKHNEWIEGKRFLLVPYHMIGARDMESGILGGYVDFMRRTHPNAPIPGVYLAEGLFRDAQVLRDRLGANAFFSALSEGTSSSGWGELAAGWDAKRFENAIIAEPGSEERSQLISALISKFFSSYDTQAGGQGEAFLSLDQGLSVLSKHAQSLGYDALILFLDELILWLASHAQDLKFVQQEGQKLAKLVEAQTPDRPVPIISFVARQRDLRKLIGDTVPGAERLNFGDVLQHWEGRFHRITLEDRNLPTIAEKRVLKCKNLAARQELDAAFEQIKMRESAMNTLLTSDGDREIFRKVYPFSPALVQTLIAVSSVLQRERTALKVMMQLLVDGRDTLTVGDIVPVGELFDVIAHGDEAFSQEMAIHFDNSKRLYHQKLLPLLEKQHGVRREDLEMLLSQDPKRIAFRNHDRLVKTLLLSALVPEVESLRGLNAERLAALNHGSVKTPIPGREGQEVLRLCKDWARSVGEIRIGEEANPTVSIQLSGVDTDSILEQAKGEDSRGNRIRLLRQMIFKQLDIVGEDEFEQYRDFLWRNTKRSCVVLFKNIRELPDSSLENTEERWKLVIDFPFDEGNHGPRDDLSKLDLFRESHPDGAKTICWVPAFFSAEAQKDLGTLVIIEHILTGDRFLQYANHLSPQDRQAAKSLLENQRSMLRLGVQSCLDAAYGLESLISDALDKTHDLELHERFVSLHLGFELKPPVAANLKGAVQKLLEQVLELESPAAPLFEAEITTTNLEKVRRVVSEAAQIEDGRVYVEDRKLRLLLRQIANPLQLGQMGQDATHFVLEQYWKNHFTRKAVGGAITVSQLREWLDTPKAMGLPKEVQNLVILTFALQSNRTFYRHNVPIEPTLKDLPNDCELREQKLPDESQWQLALERANNIFRVEVSPLRKVNNIAALESEVIKKATASCDATQKYVHWLRDCLNRFGLSAETDRMRTATATSVIVEQICSGQPNDIVRILTALDFATTEIALRDCLGKASALGATLEQTSWEIFESIRDLTDERGATADELCNTVEQALCSDEHVIPLSSALKAAQLKAVRLLTKPTPTPPPEPRLPPPVEPTIPRQGRIVNQGTKENLEITAARSLLSDLGQNLRESQKLSLSISWIVEEVSTE